MKFAKTIKIFLIDGDPNGRMSCELSNWTGKAYKIPRIKIKDCNDREDLSNTGVYLLFGKDDSGRDKIYIGEAESVLKRLNQHISQKDFWNETIVFVSKDENLNKAHIKYLENRLFEIAKANNRYFVENTSTPTQSSISESDRAEMEEFLNNIKLLVNTLGHKTFETKTEENITGPSFKEQFQIKAIKGADAKGIPTSEGFVVLKGSKIANETTPSLANYIKKLRDELIEKKIVLQTGEAFELIDDYIFNSPSSAASLVLGRSANGLTEWILPNGKSLKTIETNSVNEQD
jgi:hypothetical protein